MGQDSRSGRTVPSCNLAARRRNGPQRVLRPGIHAVKIRYYRDTDTVYIEFREAPIAETRDFDENTVLDLDAQGNICAITVEHASRRTGIPQFSYEQVPA